MVGKEAAAKKSTPGRSERLEARITAEQKDLFQRAAELQGRTLTDFVLASVHEAAVRTIEEMQSIQLTAEESRAFAEAMLAPDVSPSRLKAAAQRYIATVGG